MVFLMTSNQSPRHVWNCTYMHIVVFTYTVHILYIYCTYTVHILYIYCTYTVHILYIYTFTHSTYSIQIGILSRLLSYRESHRVSQASQAGGWKTLDLLRLWDEELLQGLHLKCGENQTFWRKRNTIFPVNVAYEWNNILIYIYIYHPILGWSLFGKNWGSKMIVQVCTDEKKKLCDTTSQYLSSSGRFHWVNRDQIENS